MARSKNFAYAEGPHETYEIKPGVVVHITAFQGRRVVNVLVDNTTALTLVGDNIEAHDWWGWGGE
jgi:type IV secretory pathway VirB9-like protein